MLVLPVLTLFAIALEPFTSGRTQRLLDLTYKLDHTAHAWLAAKPFENRLLHNGTSVKDNFETWYV